MARTFQLVQIFPQLTVAETIAAAVVSQQAANSGSCSPALSDDTARECQRVRGNRPTSLVWSDRLESVSRMLSQGEKKLLDVASAFALNPEVILLDEPTSGVSTAEKHGADADPDRCRQGRQACKAIILIEHDMDLVAAYSQRIVALAEGKRPGRPAARPVFRRSASSSPRSWASETGTDARSQES